MRSGHRFITLLSQTTSIITSCMSDGHSTEEISGWKVTSLKVNDRFTANYYIIKLTGFWYNCRFVQV